MKESGDHDVPPVGLTDVMVNPGINAPQDAFEATAKEKTLAGGATHEEVVTIDGKRICARRRPFLSSWKDA